MGIVLGIIGAVVIVGLIVALRLSWADSEYYRAGWQKCDQRHLARRDELIVGHASELNGRLAALRRVNLMQQRGKAVRLLEVVRTLATSKAITDTIWHRNGVTACEELGAIAGELGATEAEIEQAFLPSKNVPRRLPELGVIYADGGHPEHVPHHSDNPILVQGDI